MKCREFQNSVADYEGGRLERQQAQAMDAHKAVCSACARSCVRERDLRQSFQSAPDPAPVSDIWPQVATQLQAPSAVPRSLFAYRRVWGGALCGVGACAVFLGIGYMSRPMLPQDSDPAQPFSVAAAERLPANDTIISLVSKMQDGPDTETEAGWAEEASDHQEKRSLLLGERN